jgi:hypothetical protein
LGIAGNFWICPAGDGQVEQVSESTTLDMRARETPVAAALSFFKKE